MEHDGRLQKKAVILTATALRASDLPQTVSPHSVCRDIGDHRVLESGTKHLSAADLQGWWLSASQTELQPFNIYWYVQVPPAVILNDSKFICFV